MELTKEQILLADVTATTTSSPMNVEGYTKMSFVFKRSNHSAGSSAFAIQGTVDGTNWVALAFIDNLANTNAQTLTRVTSKSLASDTSVMVFLDQIALKAVRVVVTETTDGTHYAAAIAST